MCSCCVTTGGQRNFCCSRTVAMVVRVVIHMRVMLWTVSDFIRQPHHDCPLYHKSVILLVLGGISLSLSLSLSLYIYIYTYMDISLHRYPLTRNDSYLAIQTCVFEAALLPLTTENKTTLMQCGVLLAYSHWTTSDLITIASQWRDWFCKNEKNNLKKTVHGLLAKR